MMCVRVNDNALKLFIRCSITTFQIIIQQQVVCLSALFNSFLFSTSNINKMSKTQIIDCCIHGLDSHRIKRLFLISPFTIVVSLVSLNRKENQMRIQMCIVVCLRHPTEYISEMIDLIQIKYTNSDSDGHFVYLFYLLIIHSKIKPKRCKLEDWIPRIPHSINEPTRQLLKRMARHQSWSHSPISFT